MFYSSASCLEMCRIRAFVLVPLYGRYSCFLGLVQLSVTHFSLYRKRLFHDDGLAVEKLQGMKSQF